jgi:uncharacterized peroxidase-related enzyme
MDGDTEMNRIPLVGDDAAPTRATLAGIRAKLGMVPNLARVLAHSPAALNGWLGLAGALSGGVLPARLRESIALAVAAGNGCEYCLSAHAALGARAGLTEAEIDAAVAGGAADAKEAAALAFARAVLAGGDDASALAALRAAGWDDAAAVEIIAHVALNLLTNRINTVAGTPVDFPLRRLPEAA